MTKKPLISTLTAGRRVIAVSAEDQVDAVERGDVVVTVAAEHYVSDPRFEVGIIRIADRQQSAAVRANGVIAVATKNLVQAISTVDSIVASIAVKDVIPSVTQNSIVSVAAMGQVIAVLSVNQVGILAAIQLIIATATKQIVSAKFTKQMVVSTLSKQQVTITHTDRSLTERMPKPEVAIQPIRLVIIADSIFQMSIHVVDTGATESNIRAQAALNLVIVQFTVEHIIAGLAQYRVIA